MNRTLIFSIALVFCILSSNNLDAQVPDPDLGKRAEWMRGTYGLNWKPVRTQNGGSESDDFSIAPFLDQIKHLKNVDYIQLHLGESSIYSMVHIGPNGLIESFWEGDTDSDGNIINLAVPRASSGRDPFLEFVTAVREAGLKVMVYVNGSNMLRRAGSESPAVLPDVTDRWMEWCDTDSTAQAFIDSKAYHIDPDWPNRKYMFCYAEFILKEYALRYGDLIDAWCFDSGRYMWEHGGDSKDSDDVEEQRIYQAFTDACHAGNPDAAIAFQNSPGSNDLVNNPFSPATLFDDYMFGHPFNGGKVLGEIEANYFSLEWIAERNGYVHTNDGRDRTWDDKVLGHFDPPMSTTAWNRGAIPALTNEEFVDWYSLALEGGGAVSLGVPLVGPTNWTKLYSHDYGIEQMSLLDAYLCENQYPGAPNWARQETYLPPASIGKDYSRILVNDIDFWDPEGDEITNVLIVDDDRAPAWLTISKTDSISWTLSGTSNETVYTEYEFSIRVTDATGERDRLVNLKVVDPDSIPVTGLMVSPGRASLFVDDTKLLTAVVYPLNAIEKSVSWNSSDTTIANVSSSGLVVAKDTGRVIITATTLDGGFSDECEVNVLEFIPVTGIAITPDSVSLTSNGETKSLSATIFPSIATVQSVSWSTDNASVATVNSNGVVTANGAGNAIITATTEDGNFTDTCIVTVELTSVVSDNIALGGVASQSSTNYNAPASLAIDNNTDGLFNNGSVTHTNKEENAWWEVDLGAEYSIADIVIFGRTDDCCMDRLSNFSVFVFNSNGAEVHSETFTSYPDPSVSSNAGGIVGQRVRIVSLTSFALSLAEVQVFEALHVDSLVVSPDSLSITVGDAKLLSATIHPSNATNQSINWYSSDTSVVIVYPSGIIRAQGTGSAIITAESLGGGFSDECQVTVLLPVVPVTSIVVSPDSLSIIVGDSLSLNIDILPSTATDTSVNWYSGNTSIATVDSSGLVTAIDTGITSITATSTDGGLADSCIVTVIEDPDTQIAILETRNKDLILYPNPVNSTLNYDFRNIFGVEASKNIAAKEAIRVSIYSISGKLLFIQEIENLIGQIDIRGLNNGLFIMRILGETLIVTSFVKN
ncbi:Ig-like domain-containing protein [Bacteroidota bacterium]